MSAHFELIDGPEALDATARADCGCFEHSGWVAAVGAARARAHRLVCVRAVRERGADAWLIGAVHRRSGLPVFESMPMSAYGGWLCDQPLAIDEQRELTHGWLRGARWPVVMLTSRPNCADALPSPSPPRWLPSRWPARLAPLPLQTHVLDLTGDDAALLQRARPRMRSYLRAAGDADFGFERRSGLAGLKATHAWYAGGSSNWSTKATGLLPEAFFVALAEDPRAEAWTIYHQHREVGAALFLTGARQVQYQASGTQRIEAPLTAMEAMIWHAARHYRDRGFASLNFGASAGLDGVVRFKEKFGAVAQTYRRCTYLFPAWRRSS